MIIDDLNKRPLPTTPDDQSDPVRFGQPVETAKDVFTIELRRFFDRANQSSSKIEELPTVRKFDVSFTPGESSLETAVNLIQKLPNINEHLPLVAIVGATGRNLPMGIGGTFVSNVIYPPSVVSANAEPYVLVGGSTLIYTTTPKGDESRQSTITFRASRFTNIATATAQEVADEINGQALYATARVESGKVVLSYGGPFEDDVRGDIEIVGGTAASIIGFTPTQAASYRNMIPYHRYVQSTALDMALEVVAEDYNIRTELTDLVWNFFTVQMDDRDYMFLGRSAFDTNIQNESYQLVLKPEMTLSGEQEVPRPGDERDKLYVNRINISLTSFQYVDRAVVIPNSTTPLYMPMPVQDETIPFKN